jgi:cytochrome c-type biogenesis protein CcsB
MSLATYSDWTYAAALVIYVGALLLHLVQLSGRVSRKELVPAGGGAAPAVEEDQPHERFGRMGVSLTVLGALVHLVSLVLRGIAVERVPWGNLYEFGSSICLVAVVAWLVVLRREPSAQRLGAFVLLPIVILLFVSGTLLYTQAAPLIPPLQSYWIVIHVSAAIISTGVLVVAGMASVLYLVRMRRDDGEPSRLPAADVLDRLAYRSTVFAFPVWTFALITGAIWAETAWGRYWGWDPKETVAFIAWVIYAGYLHARATAGWRRRGAAWINVAGLATMVFNLFFVNLVVAGFHSYAGV